MQTQSIQNQSTSTLRPPKSAPLPNGDFKSVLAIETDRTPVCAAPEQPAPAQPQKAPVKNAQGAKPAQQAQAAQNTQNAQDANQSGEADSAASADEAPPADATPATAAARPSGESEQADSTPVADPAAGMLAMLAAYSQLTARPEPVAEGGETDAAAGAGLPALPAGIEMLRPDLASKSMVADKSLLFEKGALAGKEVPGGLDALADKPADTPGKDGTPTLHDTLMEQAGADRLLRAGAGLEAKADQKVQEFAAKLAAHEAASKADAAPAAQPMANPAAQAMAATVQAANAVAANQLQARVGTSAWEQQLGQKVVWMVAGGDQSASLTLNPPDLGPLQVVLSVSNDSATATFTAHQPETRQAIENALPKLREMMSEAGISLGDASVSAGTQEQQQAFAEQARGGSGGAGGGRHGNGDAAGSQEDAQPVIRRTILGAVDTFA
ncbi:flagellar hook-length control protein FliK [Pseudoduganella sp. SL102]|uniref:flagellar hook-length control protein FliK n=1 Tax=Pseudoduganella sp. SL102 TaxID=2995154 RepID=UPI00248B2379|nr:flagellar hook-length control protein FliK [Pseudoduganella sp. SL102]WBS01770.1 flagellar hook-length control protein FliK [Pseudoduganella sp. SL102]